MIQAHVFFSGAVQGVGFRYTTQRLATTLGLKGWVRNLAQGGVELMVEGSKETIEQLLQNIDEHYTGSIRNKTVSYSDAVEHFEDFEIKA